MSHGWNAPRTWVTGEALAAGHLSTELMDNMNATMPAKAVAVGDIFVATGPNHIKRLAIGADQAVLTADSTQDLGMKWERISQAQYSVYSPGTYAVGESSSIDWPDASAEIMAGGRGTDATKWQRFVTSLVMPSNFGTLLALEVLFYAETVSGTLDWRCDIMYISGSVAHVNPVADVKTETGTIELTSNQTYRFDVTSALPAVTLAADDLIGIRFWKEASSDMIGIQMGGVEARYTAAP